MKWYALFKTDHTTKNFVKSFFNNFHLIHNWILSSIWPLGELLQAFILNDTTRLEMTQTLIFIFFKGSKARKKISTLTLAWTLVNWGLNNYVPNFQRNGHVFLLLPPLGTFINFLHKRERLNPNLFHTVLSCGKT